MQSLYTNKAKQTSLVKYQTMRTMFIQLIIQIIHNMSVVCGIMFLLDSNSYSNLNMILNILNTEIMNMKPNCTFSRTKSLYCTLGPLWSPICKIRTALMIFFSSLRLRRMCNGITINYCFISRFSIGYHGQRYQNTLINLSDSLFEVEYKVHASLFVWSVDEHHSFV